MVRRGNYLPGVDASKDLLGRVRVHERAKEEVVDDRLKTGNAHERIRTVIDVGQPMVTHVLQAGSAEGNHELIRRLDRNLVIGSPVEQQQGRRVPTDLMEGRRLLVQ